MITINCAYCKSPITARPSARRKYCNNACQGLHKLAQSKTRIEEGQVDQAITLKKYLIATRGHHCEECTISNWNNKPLSLHVDHVDGNSDNNYPKNLRLLCPNCHSQTETFCGRNKKNTKRNTYNQRYRIRKLYGT